MEVEEVGSNPTKLAQEVLRQLAYEDGHIQIHAVAKGLDIDEIRAELLTNFEGALLTNNERSIGKILVNTNSRRHRQRFTIAHELGHFLNLAHRPTTGESFLCSKLEIAAVNTGRKSSQTRHEIQEQEANRFAIELLAPKKRVEHLSRDQPCFHDIQAISAEFDISKQAAAHRYVELHPAPLAILFSENGRVCKARRNDVAPSLRSFQELELPVEHRLVAKGSTVGPTQVNAEKWIASSTTSEIWIETFAQANGHSMTLVSIDFDYIASNEGDEAGIEDAFQRFSRHNER